MKVKSVKSKKKSKKAKKVTKKAKSVKKGKAKGMVILKSNEIDQQTIDSLRAQFYTSLKQTAKNHGFITEQCGCTPEKGCLDPEIEPVEFKDHQVHDGLDNEAELTLKPTETHNEENMEVSEEFRAKMEYMNRGFLGRLFYRIGKLFSKNKKPLRT